MCVQNSLELTKLQEQSDIIESLVHLLEKKKEEAETLQSRLHFQQNTTVSKQIVLRLESKIKEMESIVEMERVSRIKTEASYGGIAILHVVVLVILVFERIKL